jgi:hypothetical protein
MQCWLTGLRGKVGKAIMTCRKWLLKIDSCRLQVAGCLLYCALRPFQAPRSFLSSLKCAIDIFSLASLDALR